MSKSRFCCHGDIVLSCDKSERSWALLSGETHFRWWSVGESHDLFGNGACNAYVCTPSVHFGYDCLAFAQCSVRQTSYHGKMASSYMQLHTYIASCMYPHAHRSCPRRPLLMECRSLLLTHGHADLNDSPLAAFHQPRHKHASALACLLLPFHPCRHRCHGRMAAPCAAAAAPSEEARARGHE